MASDFEDRSNLRDGRLTVTGGLLVDPANRLDNGREAAEPLAWIAGTA
jgi:hypothetical protein